MNRNYPDIQSIITLSEVLDIPLTELLQKNRDIVENISDDTLARKSLSRRTRILYVLLFILIVSSCMIFFKTQNLKDIFDGNKIVSAKIKSNTVIVKTDLPFYQSIEGYFTKYSNNSDSLEVSIFTKISTEHSQNIKIPLSQTDKLPKTNIYL